MSRPSAAAPRESSTWQRWGPKAHAKLIKIVRLAATKVFQENTDWERECLIPLFLIAFGLLRYLPRLGNQRGAMRVVEALAEHLTQRLGIH